MTYKAIILDMDGTLVNTERLWKDAERDLLSAYDRTYDTEIHADFLGLAVTDFIPAIQKAYDLAHISAKELEDSLEDRVRLLLATEAKPTLGAIDLINYIVDNAIPCAIASNSSHAIIEATLRQQPWADSITERYSADDVPNAKPAPDLFLYTATKLNTEPQDCIVIEDSLNGVKAGVAAGITCLAVPDFELSNIDMFKAVTPHIFESLTEVLPFIQNNI
jgi:mannitol-1-/sugar-/sorbitol-6-/2-deoxyglucose-6-phosphatase